MRNPLGADPAGHFTPPDVEPIVEGATRVALDKAGQVLAAELSAALVEDGANRSSG